MHFLTGHYGLAFDESTGELLRLGAFTDGLTAAEAALRPNTDIEQLTAATLRFEAGDATATSFQGTTPDATDRVQMIDGGRFMNRVRVPTVGYSNPAITGEVQIASMPRHVVFSQVVQGAADARIVLGGELLAAFPTVTWFVADRALTLTDDQGDGWLFAVHPEPETASTLTWADGELTAERAWAGTPSDELTVSLLAAPVSALGAAEHALYASPTGAVEILGTLLDHTGAVVGTTPPAVWDSMLGAFRVPLATLQNAGGPGGPDWEDPAFHHWHGRQLLHVDTGGLGPVSVPLALHGTDRVSWYVVGGVPSLRDEAGEPTGLPLQISKNWHGEYWYHFYSQPTFHSGGPETYEFTVASSKWGSAHAASHAQLSLVGWGEAGGHWDESAIGAFGESVTYDPDVTLGRAMVDDVRPVLVQSDQRWGWTGNVGGADFLRYRTDAEPYWERRLARVRSQYAAPGPNLTDVVYSGVTTDGRIQAEIRVQMGASDDVVRVHYHLDYTFLDDVAYDRLAFFQVAADNYGDNGFARYAAGNAAGVLLDEPVPDHGTTGYAADEDRGIPIEGDAPWVFLYDNQRDWDSLPEHYADVGFVVREFEAHVGDGVITTPHINLHQTNNGGSQIGFELGLPHEDGSPWCGAPCGGETRFVPAGSTVSATIEYVVPPADKSRYFGAGPWLVDLPAEDYRTPQMAVALANGNDRAVEVHQGTLVRLHPVEITAEPGPVAAEFTLTGGIGHTPLSFHGLNRHDGWALEVQDLDGWTPIDQSVHGNDFWQATQRPDDGTWTLTWTVPHAGTARYRLAWGP